MSFKVNRILTASDGTRQTAVVVTELDEEVDVETDVEVESIQITNPTPWPSPRPPRKNVCY